MILFVDLVKRDIESILLSVNVLITTLYAAILALYFATLSGMVILRRAKRRVAFGDAGDKGLRHRIRGHANFAEYVPLALLLLLLLEFAGQPGWLLHAFGATLVVGRTAHAIAFFREPHNMQLRTLATGLTLTVVITEGLACAYIAASGLLAS